MSDLEDELFTAYPDKPIPYDEERDKPMYCCMEDEEFEESLEEES